MQNGESGAFPDRDPGVHGELSHIEINVADLNAARDFWGWLLPLLGYVEYQTWNGGFSYRRRRTYIVFVETEPPYRDVPFHRKRNGLNHLAFHAASPEEVDRLLTLMRQRGVPLLYQERYPHAAGEANYALFCEAPDRLKVEIVCESSEFA